MNLCPRGYTAMLLLASHKDCINSCYVPGKIDLCDLQQLCPPMLLHSTTYTKTTKKVSSPIMRALSSQFPRLLLAMEEVTMMQVVFPKCPRSKVAFSLWRSSFTYVVLCLRRRNDALIGWNDTLTQCCALMQCFTYDVAVSY